MSERLELTRAVLALAKIEARTPEGRTRLVRVLCETLVAVVAAPTSIRPALPPEIASGLADATASLIMAGDHMEFVAERLATLTT